MIMTMYSQILSWNLKTSFYQLLEPPNPLLFKMTRSVSLLHIPFDAQKFKFHPAKTGSISRASWTFTPTMIPQVGLGEVTSMSPMSLDGQPKKKNKKGFLCIASSLMPILHFLCLYFKLYSLANLHPLTRHINIFSCTISVPLIASHCTISSTSRLFNYQVTFSVLFQSSTFSEHKTLAIQKKTITTSPQP